MIQSTIIKRFLALLLLLLLAIISITVMLSYIVKIILKFKKSKSIWIRMLNKIVCAIIFFSFLFFISFYFSSPLLCDHVGDLQNGVIPRTPLLQPGQTLRTLPHGTYNVTGGIVQIGNLGSGNVTKVIGVCPNSASTTPLPNMLTWVLGTQPYNSEFASILFELREAGQKRISHSCLDYAFSGRQRVTPIGNFNAVFIESFRTSRGMTNTKYGETDITNAIINQLAL